MELSAEERARWEEFKTKHSREKRFPGRAEKIIEMSKAGASLTEISGEVGGAFEIISETRSRARRRGMW